MSFGSRADHFGRLVYPIGCAWAKIMPMRKFRTFGVEWTFNTGPFTIKEHVMITVCDPGFIQSI
jgi:hypothetical protein